MTHIFISAGEASGDLLGANLASNLLKQDPNLILTGMGGKRMQEAGVSIRFDANKLSVVGITEIITHLPSILWTWHCIKRYLKETKPDLVILIDFPDTHFRIMKYAKKRGIKVLYYVSPQIWAWRTGRIHTLKKYIDHMAVLFGFEEKLYRDAGIPVTFVGHPLSQLVKPTLSKEAAYSFFELDSNRPIVALFPGSRNSELQNHLPLILKSAQQIRAQKPTTQFVLVLAPHFKRDDMKLPADIQVIQHHLYDLLSITDAAIAVSGTVTLEIALMGVPLCIIYRVNKLTYWIAKKLVRTKYIGLCNIIAEKPVAKEFIQDAATPIAISDEISQLLNNRKYRAEKCALLDNMKSQLHGGASLTKTVRHLLKH